MRELGSWGSDPLDQQSSELLQGAWDRAVTFGDPEDIAGIGVILSERLFRSGLPEKSARTALDAHHLLATMTDSGHWMDSILVANACKSLMAVGRWDEAGALLDRACALDPFGASRLARVRLLIARGALDQAEDDLGQAKHLQRHDQPYFGLEYDELLAELRLWRKDPLGALSDVVDTLDKLDDTAVHDLGAGLCALGVRAAADLAEGARATHDGRRLELALDNGRRLAKTQTVADPDAPARRATVSGELGRLEREPQPSAWETAAREWGTRRRPYDRALALWRQAEAVLETGVGRGVATPLLHEAAAIAESLGAVSLQAEVDGLATRARLPRRAPHSQTNKPGDRGIAGLSEREIAVLRLIVQGRTNREIGQELFISPKTVSVHVTRLMQKLDVRSRVQAAGVAHRLGL